MLLFSHLLLLGGAVVLLLGCVAFTPSFCVALFPSSSYFDVCAHGAGGGEAPPPKWKREESTTTQEEEEESCTTPKEAGKQHRPRGGRGEREKATLAHKWLDAAPFGWCCVPLVSAGGAATLPLVLLGGVAATSPSSFGAVLLWLVLLSYLPLVWCGAAALFSGGIAFSSLLLFKVEVRLCTVSRGSPSLLCGGAASRPLSFVAVQHSHPPPCAWCCSSSFRLKCNAFFRISCLNFEKIATKTRARSSLIGPAREGSTSFSKEVLFFRPSLFLVFPSRSNPSCGWCCFLPLSLFVGGAVSLFLC